MIKIFDELLFKSLILIFSDCIDAGVYPDISKKSNIVPVHKRGNKQIISNCRPVPLLPICNKILEKLIFNSMMTFPNDNNFLSSNQSGLRPPDSCECNLFQLFMISINNLIAILL